MPQESKLLRWSRPQALAGVCEQEVEEDSPECSEGSVASCSTGSRSCRSNMSGQRCSGDEGSENFEKHWDDEGEWETSEAEGKQPGTSKTPVRRQAQFRNSLASSLGAWGSEEEREGVEWIRSEHAEVFFGSVIGLNALVLGLEVEAELRFGEASMAVMLLYVSQLLFALVFFAELALRARTLGLRRAMCGSAHRAFDSGLLLLTLLDLCVITPLVRPGVLGGAGWRPLDALGSLRILQLLRLVRIVRVLRVSRQLSLLVLGLARSFLSVLWAFLMLFVVIYIGAVFCTSELGLNRDERLSLAFGTLWRSMYAHFKIMTLEAWPELCSWAMEQNSLWALYFILYILITNLALVNLLTGLIMDGVLQGAKSEDWTGELAVLEAEPFLRTLQGLLCDQDQKTDEFLLDQKRFEGLMAEPLFQELLELYGISLRIEPEDFFILLDSRGLGELSVTELAASLLRLRGSRDALHPLLVRNDLYRENRRLLSSLHECELRVSQRYNVEALQVERSLCGKLRGLLTSASRLEKIRGNLGCSAAHAEVLFQEKATMDAGEGGQEGAQGREGQGTCAVEEGRGTEALHAWSKPEFAGSVSSGEPKSGDAAWMSSLLRQASTRMQELRESVQRAEAELRTSLAREAALTAALLMRTTSRSRASQAAAAATAAAALGEEAPDPQAETQA